MDKLEAALAAFIACVTLVVLGVLALVFTCVRRADAARSAPRQAEQVQLQRDYHYGYMDSAGGVVFYFTEIDGGYLMSVRSPRVIVALADGGRAQ